jgi:hypothetical protein
VEAVSDPAHPPVPPPDRAGSGSTESTELNADVELDRLLVRSREAIATAVTLVSRLPRFAADDEQRVLVLLDIREERAREIANVGVRLGMCPPYAQETEALILVIPVSAARRLVEDVSTVPIERFDDAAAFARAARGHIVLVTFSLGMTWLGYAYGQGSEVARA